MLRYSAKQRSSVVMMSFSHKENRCKCFALVDRKKIKHTSVVFCTAFMIMSLAVVGLLGGKSLRNGAMYVNGHNALLRGSKVP